MTRNGWRWAAQLSPVALLVLWATMPTVGLGSAQAPAAQRAAANAPAAPHVYGTQNGEWQTYGGDLSSTHYSALDQINAENFGKLEVAFRIRTEMLGPRPEFQLQVTPLMVKGVIYMTGGTRRAVIAADGQTGEMLWMYSMNEGKRGESAPRQLSGRGLTYWTGAGGRTKVWDSEAHRSLPITKFSMILPIELLAHRNDSRGAQAQQLPLAADTGAPAALPHESVPVESVATNAQVAELVDDLLVFQSETRNTLYALMWVVGIVAVLALVFGIFIVFR